MTTSKHRWRRSVATVWVTLALLAPAPAVAEEPTDAAEYIRSPYAVSGLSGEQFERVQWAIGLFDRGGLWLPPLTVRAFPNTDACSGRTGSARHDDGPSEVRLCLGADRAAFEWTLLHELAHVWSRTAVARAHHDMFLAVRSLASWSDGAWAARGSEHASEVIVWGLIDRPVVPGHITNNSCRELLIAYRALTGTHPLHGFTSRCE